MHGHMNQKLVKPLWNWVSNGILFSLAGIFCIASTEGAPTYKIFEECDPTGSTNGINNFTICGFKANSNININSVNEVYNRYAAVSVFYSTGHTRLVDIISSSAPAFFTV
jgi:hypothetical protein